MPEIKARLAAAENDADPCEEWGIEVRLVVDAAEAKAIVERLPLALGLDIETVARPGQEEAERPFLQITVKGARSCTWMDHPGFMRTFKANAPLARGPSRTCCKAKSGPFLTRSGAPASVRKTWQTSPA